MRHRRSASIGIGLISALLVNGCSDADNPVATGNSDAGTDSATAQLAADYEKAFPQDRVARLDIVISQDKWNTMVADMESMLGTFGQGQNGGQQGDGGLEGGVPPFDGGLPSGDGGMPPMDGGGQPPMDGGGQPPMDGGGQPPMDGGGQPPMDGGQANPGGGGNVELIPRTPVYVECQVKVDSTTLEHVGIRFKGNSSLAMPWQQGVWKLPFRLNFDGFKDTYPETSAQSLYGFRNLSLSNGQADESLLRDKIGTEVFANAGLPAPATAFYRVYIDHGDGPVYFGLYTGIELPQDDSFLDRSFLGHKGNLYKPSGVGAQWQTWDQATLGKENNVTAADYSDAQSFFDALHKDRTDAAVWRTGLETTFNSSLFLHWLALNTVVQDWDSYGQMAHNYYIYADPKQNNQLQWIPWDHSYAFTSDRALSLSMSEANDQWPLIRYLLDDSVYQQQYRSYLDQAVTIEYEATKMTARFQSAHDLIKPYVVGADGEIPGYTFLSSSDAFDAGLANLISHVGNRKAQVTQYLAQ